ncbi:MAG: transposase [Deltaproteobacteria bacterium]|nr:transposase [Deltaproteobacteria bacterium]
MLRPLHSPGGPISNHRISSIDDTTVTLTYKDHNDDNKTKRITLNADELIRRFLLHVLSMPKDHGNH